MEEEVYYVCSPYSGRKQAPSNDSKELFGTFASTNQHGTYDSVEQSALTEIRPALARLLQSSDATEIFGSNDQLKRFALIGMMTVLEEEERRKLGGQARPENRRILSGLSAASPAPDYLEERRGAYTAGIATEGRVMKRTGCELRTPTDIKLHSRMRSSFSCSLVNMSEASDEGGRLSELHDATSERLERYRPRLMQYKHLDEEKGVITNLRKEQRGNSALSS